MKRKNSSHEEGFFTRTQSEVWAIIKCYSPCEGRSSACKAKRAKRTEENGRIIGGRKSTYCSKRRWGTFQFENLHPLLLFCTIVFHAIFSNESVGSLVFFFFFFFFSFFSLRSDEGLCLETSETEEEDVTEEEEAEAEDDSAGKLWEEFENVRNFSWKRVIGTYRRKRPVERGAKREAIGSHRRNQKGGRL